MSEVLPFAEHAEAYRKAGFWPRPVQPGTKRPPMKTWEKPDPEWTLGELNMWTDRYGHMGLGAVMGSPFQTAPNWVLSTSIATNMHASQQPFFEIKPARVLA